MQNLKHTKALHYRNHCGDIVSWFDRRNESFLINLGNDLGFTGESEGFSRLFADNFGLVIELSENTLYEMMVKAKAPKSWAEQLADLQDPAPRGMSVGI